MRDRTGAAAAKDPKPRALASMPARAVPGPQRAGAGVDAKRRADERANDVELLGGIGADRIEGRQFVGDCDADRVSEALDARLNRRLLIVVVATGRQQRESGAEERPD
jgi:hypothetical protein